MKGSGRFGSDAKQRFAARQVSLKREKNKASRERAFSNPKTPTETLIKSYNEKLDQNTKQIDSNKWDDTGIVGNLFKTMVVPNANALLSLQNVLGKADENNVPPNILSNPLFNTLSPEEKMDLQDKIAFGMAAGSTSNLGGKAIGSGFVRVGKSKAEQEVLDIAESIADEARKVSEFTPYQFGRAAEDKGILYNQAVALGQKAVEPVSESVDKAKYVLTEDSLGFLRDAAKRLSENAGRASTIVTQADLPKGVDILNIQKALALGKDATISPQSTLNNAEDFVLDIAGVTPSTVVTKANDMFRSGAETAKGIATSIFPDFVGNFNATPMLRSGAGNLIDMLKEARGGIAPVTGRVLSEGEKVLDLSKQLYNANDHGSPKARAAATQAIEQLLAKALDIKLPDSFYQMRQAELDLINDPNRNNVLIDFLGNTGKGGVSLPELATFLQRQLQSGKLSEHLRGSYSQLLSDVLQGKYRQIQSEINFIRGQGENPLSKVINDDVYKGVGDYVDELRSKLINDDNYTQALFDMDMKRLSEAVQNATSNITQRGKKLSWNDIDSFIKAQSGLF